MVSDLKNIKVVATRTIACTTDPVSQVERKVYWTANTSSTTTPTSITIPRHFTGPFILALFAAPGIGGTAHTVPSVVFAYWPTQDIQPWEELVELELGTHWHVTGAVLKGGMV